jgi:VWFA-related protein
MRQGLVGIALLLLITAVAQAQQAGPRIDPETPTLTITARTVLIDAVVTDRSGRLVPNLTRDDFQVFENGVPQKTNFFEPHVDAVTVKAAPLNPLPPNTYSNLEQIAPTGAVNVVLIDSLNTNTADRIGIRRQLMDTMSHLPNGVPIAVLELGDQLRIVQGFTSDPAEARASVARLLSGTSQPLTQALPGGNKTQTSSMDSINSAVLNAPGGAQTAAFVDALQGFMEHAYDAQQNQQVFTTLEALQEISRYVSPIPARKNLLWVSGSFPLCIPGMTYSKDEDCPYNDLIEKAINSLAAARISLYPIDAGIVGDPSSDIGGKTEQPALSSGSVNLGKEQFRRITAEVMAEATGGKAFHGNDLRTEMADAMGHGSSYYTLAYTPTDEKEKNVTRKIEIRVTSGKYNVFYRRTYFRENSNEPAVGPPKPSDPLRPLMMHGMPAFSQVQYRLNVEPATSAATDPQVAGDNASIQRPAKRYRMGFSVSPESINLLTGQDGVQRAQVEVALIARGENGQALNWMVRQVGLVVRPDQIAQVRRSGVSFHLDFDVPKEVAYLATGVYDSSANRAGTLEVPMASIQEEVAATVPETATVPRPLPKPGSGSPRIERATTEKLTIQQLEQLVEQLHPKTDKDAVGQIAKCKLTERLTTVRLEQLQATLPGERSRSALLALADASAFLPLPQTDLAFVPVPDLEAQRAILSRAVDFVIATTKQMPNFLAEKHTTRFQDTAFGIHENDPVVTTPDLYHLVDSTVMKVRYREGQEENLDPSSEKPADGPTMGLTTSGIFGPLLETMMRDILNGKIGWAHWEQSSSGPIAVFRYAVPKERANYRITWCCIAAELGAFRKLDLVPSYHGEINIDPRSGAVTRIVMISDIDAGQPVSTADVFVEYGPVEIGGKTYQCPVRSGAILVAKSPVQHGTSTQNGISIKAMVSVDNLTVTAISDVHFGEYHVFRSEMKIVEH